MMRLLISLVFSYCIWRGRPPLWESWAKEANSLLLVPLSRCNRPYKVAVGMYDTLSKVSHDLVNLGLCAKSFLSCLKLVKV